MSNQNPRTEPITFPVSELDVVRQKLARAEAVLAAAVRANHTAESPIDSANSMTVELHKWDGYVAVSQEFTAGHRREDYILVGAAQ